MNKKRSFNTKGLLTSNTFILLCATILIVLVFFVINNNFLTAGNIKNIMLSMSFDGLLTIAAGMVLIGGEVDLSVGAVACFSGMAFATLCNKGIPWGLTWIICLCIGAAFGLIHAFLVNHLHFMSFIATLAMAAIYRGFVYLILRSRSIQIENKGVRVLGGTILGIPINFWIIVIIFIGYGILLRRRKLGRNIYMVGGNKESARLCGISPLKTKYFLFINSGVLSAMAGILSTARLHTATPNLGSSSETDAITAAVLGGISLMGGAGNVGGCFIGVMLLAFFTSGMTAIGFANYWQIVIKGVLLIAALALDFVTTKRREKELEREAEANA